MTEKELFVLRLKKAMKAVNKTAAELERETGLNKSTLSRYLSGKCLPKHEALKALSKALCVSENWLRGESEKTDEKLMEVFNSLSEEQKEKALDYLSFLASKDV